jgi:hypothetical protein
LCGRDPPDKQTHLLLTVTNDDGGPPTSQLSGEFGRLLRIIFIDAKASFQEARAANMSLEQLFSTSELDVVVPDTTLEFPSETTADEWLSRAKFSKIERKQAFFGQHLFFSALGQHLIYQVHIRR